MKVIFVSESLDSSYGGPAKSIPKICQDLKSRLESLTLMMISEDDKENVNNEYLDQYKLNIEMINKITFFNSFKVITKINSFFPKNNLIDNPILHINSFWKFSFYLVFQYRSGLKVWSPRGMLHKEAMKRRGILKKILWQLFFKRLVQKISCIHVTSYEEMARVRRLGIKTPVAVIEHGFDPFVEVSREESQTAKLNLDLSTEKEYVLFLSRLTEHKGLHLLLESFARVKRGSPDVNLLVGGDFASKQYRHVIQKLILKHDLLDRVVFLGHVTGESKANAFKAASLFCLPSQSENFGLVIAEALSYGVPVITSNRTPWRILEERRVGAWIELDAGLFANEIEKYVNLSETQSRKLKTEIQLLVEHNSWSNASKKMFRLYEWVLQKSERPAFLHLK